jgi:hypothetical protein
LKNQIGQLESTEKYSRDDDNILNNLKEELADAEKNYRILTN